MQILAEAEDLPTMASVKTQLISLWTVPVFGAVLLVAFLAFPGFFPPMSPEMSADQVAAFYSENRGMIWFSMITFNICGMMLLPLFMVIVVQMKRMATQSHVFAYCYLTAAVSGATLFALADIFFLVAAFRPGRNPELVMLLNDMAWIIFIAPVGALVFRSGPLAWDGAVSFWLRNGAFALFVLVMFFVLRGVLHRQAVDEGIVAHASSEEAPA